MPETTTPLNVSWWAWALFAGLVLAMLTLDLRLASRGDGKESTLRSSAFWSAGWIGLAVLFGGVVHALFGAGASVTYLTAWALEKSLSIDNIFVFILIFSELRTPSAQQRKVLYWGILGALVMRGAMIAAGMYLLDRYHWVIYPFAALIVLAAARILFAREQERRGGLQACPVLRSAVPPLIPGTPGLPGPRFTVRP